MPRKQFMNLLQCIIDWCLQKVPLLMQSNTAVVMSMTSQVSHVCRKNTHHFRYTHLYRTRSIQFTVCLRTFLKHASFKNGGAT